MGKYTREELEEAIRIYNEAHAKASETGDWSIWAALFTEDAHYIEHAYGEFHGRKEIEKWIIDAQAPAPHMTFPWKWHAIDEENDAIVFCVENTYPHPDKKFSFDNWSRIVYAGNGLFSLEEDIYNPAHFKRVYREWLNAGGEVKARTRVKPQYH